MYIKNTVFIITKPPIPCDWRISCFGNNEEIIRINTIQQEKQRYFPHYLSDQGFKGTIANRTRPSSNVYIKTKSKILTILLLVVWKSTVHSAQDTVHTHSAQCTVRIVIGLRKRKRRCLHHCSLWWSHVYRIINKFSHSNIPRKTFASHFDNLKGLTTYLKVTLQLKKVTCLIHDGSL